LDYYENKPNSETEETQNMTENEEMTENAELPTELEEDEDFSVVAERITAGRRQVFGEDDPLFEPTPKPDTPTDDAEEETDEKDPGGFFFDFTPKKLGITAVLALFTCAIFALSFALAFHYANDKVVRLTDYDMVADAEAEDTARKDAESRPETVIAEANEQFKIVLDFYDRDSVELYSSKTTLGELLEKSGIALEEGEEPTITTDTVIGAAKTVVFDKYEYVTDTVVESIPYETEQYDTDLIPRGQVQYNQYGENGEETVTYSVKLKNGEEISREETGRAVTKYPVDEITSVGVGGTFVGGDGVTYTYSYRKVVKATYYYIPNDPSTYIGAKAGHQTIAVDMNVIKLGTWVYVKNDTYDFGLRQAQDIGSAVVGDMIDIWLDGSEPGYESFAFTGLHYDMEIYFVD